MKVLEELRQNTVISLPKVFKDFAQLSLQNSGELSLKEDRLKIFFPNLCKQQPLQVAISQNLNHSKLRVGVVFSGGPASGGNNVIAGIYYGLKELHPESELIGFTNGPSGIVENKFIHIDEPLLNSHFNLGGFDLIGTGRTKIETEEQFSAAANTVKIHRLDGLVIIGGDDSNTNAAFLAEYFLANGIDCRVAGIPKTIDGDLQNEDIEISFGFDTATKTYAETIGNIMKDALSQKKYTFFIKIMGRSASHVALECALKTHPNLTLIGEEIAYKKQSLKELVDEITDLVVARSKEKKSYGVFVIPEGIIEFIPEFKQLIKELNQFNSKEQEIEKFLSNESLRCYQLLPKEIQQQLTLDRDPHGNVQVSKIETERLFIQLVSQEIQLRNEKISFNPQSLFLGYEGRSCYPSNFDCHYTYALGFLAALLIDQKATGYMAVVHNLTHAVTEWQIKAIPLISMMVLEERKGKAKPVIQKKLVSLNDNPFKTFEEMRDKWKMNDCYCFPGPIQFYGPKELTDTYPIILI